MRLRHLLLTFALAAITLTAQTTQTDDAIGKAIARFQGERKKSLDGVPDPAVERALGDLSIEGLDAAQIDRLCAVYLPQTGTAETKARFLKRLTRLAEDEAADGAVAAARAVEFVEYAPKKAAAPDPTTRESADSDVLVYAAKHPGLGKAIETGRAMSIYLQVYFAGETAALAEAGAIKKLASHVSPAWPANDVRQLTAFWDAVSVPAGGLDEKGRETLRTTTIGVLDRALADPALDPREKKYLTHERAQMSSAWATGKLIGHPAPKMTFLWSNGEKTPKSLADFAGKIVVIDFWATWCVPCVKAFPHVAALAERYKDKPVAFLGVTSLQGWMAYPFAKDGEKKKVLDLTREDELARMGPWTEAMKMTWTVLVSEEDCFNPDFGIKSIPHFAIIDALGIVRFTNVEADGDDVESRIDQLLTAAGFAAPAK